MNPTFGEPSSETGAVPTVPRPEHLGAFAALGSDATALIDLLGQADASGMNERLETIEGETPHALADWLVQHTDAHALVFWQTPTITLANAMAQEQPPNQSLAQWVGEAEQFLGVVRRNRRRITLIETTLAKSEPDAFIKRLSERWRCPGQHRSNLTQCHKNTTPSYPDCRACGDEQHARPQTDPGTAGDVAAHRARRGWVAGSAGRMASLSRSEPQE